MIGMMFKAMALKGKLAGCVGLASAMNIFGNVLFYYGDDEVCLKINDIRYIA
jgi:hypothetical protein